MDTDEIVDVEETSDDGIVSDKTTIVLNEIHNEGDMPLRNRTGKSKSSGKTAIEFVENKYERSKRKSQRRPTLFKKAFEILSKICVLFEKFEKI